MAEQYPIGKLVDNFIDSDGPTRVQELFYSPYYRFKHSHRYELGELASHLEGFPDSLSYVDGFTGLQWGLFMAAATRALGERFLQDTGETTTGTWLHNIDLYNCGAHIAQEAGYGMNPQNLRSRDRNLSFVTPDEIAFDDSGWDFFEYRRVEPFVNNPSLVKRVEQIATTFTDRTLSKFLIQTIREQTGLDHIELPQMGDVRFYFVTAQAIESPRYLGEVSGINVESDPRFGMGVDMKKFAYFVLGYLNGQTDPIPNPEKYFKQNQRPPSLVK